MDDAVTLTLSGDLLKVVVVGHVDHGKSTLVGRMLNDTHSLPDGRVEAVKAQSEARGMPFEWAFVTDALQAERDQGITIDASYIRFKSAMRDYLAAYGSAAYRAPVPHGEPPVILAALRHRMLRLAATRADGAFPYLVPTGYVAQARSLIDEAATATGRPRPLLVVSLACRLETDPLAARAAAHRYLDRYLGLPNYLANLREAGFTDADLARPGSDRLVDALVAWGDAAAVRGRLRAMLDAGADHVAMIPLTAEGLHADRSSMEALAPPW